MHKIFKIVALVFAVLGILLFAGLMFSSDAKESAVITPLIYVSYIILAIAVIMVLLFVFKNLFADKADLKKTLIILGIFFGIVLLSFIFAGSDEVRSKTNELIASSSTSKWVSTGLNTFYILGFISIALLIYTSFFKLKK